MVNALNVMEQVVKIGMRMERILDRGRPIILIEKLEDVKIVKA
jgi:hypothetical protein